MAQTGASPDSDSEGVEPPPDATLSAIERAIESAGTHDQGLLRALLEARELFPSDPAGAKRLLDDIHNAEVLLRIGRGPKAEQSGRGGGEATASSGRTVSECSDGRVGKGALLVYGDAVDGEVLQRHPSAGAAPGLLSPGMALREWQSVLCDLLSFSKNDIHSMRRKLSYAVQLSQQNLLARSTIVPLELQHVLDTSDSAIRLQGDLRSFILEFSESSDTLFRICTNCSARRLVRRSPAPPQNRFSCGHSCCVFPVRSCKPGGWDELDDWRALFPRPLLVTAASAPGIQGRRLRQAEEEEVAHDRPVALPPSAAFGAGADMDVLPFGGRTGTVFARRVMPSGRQHQQQPQMRPRGAPQLPHHMGARQHGLVEEEDDDEDYMGPPLKAARRTHGAGSVALSLNVPVDMEDDEQLDDPPSLAPWLTAAGAVAAVAASAGSKAQPSGMPLSALDEGERQRVGSHGDRARAAGYGHAAGKAVPMMTAGGGGRHRLVAVGSSGPPSASGPADRGPAEALPRGLTAPQQPALSQQQRDLIVKAAVAAAQQQVQQQNSRQSREYEYDLQPRQHKQASDAEVGLPVGHHRTVSLGDSGLVSNGRGGGRSGPRGRSDSAHDAAAALSQHQLLRNMDRAMQAPSDRDVGESRLHTRGSYNSKEEVPPGFVAMGRGRGGGDSVSGGRSMAREPPDIVEAPSLNTRLSTDSGTTQVFPTLPFGARGAQGGVPMPGWGGPKGSREVPQLSEVSGLSLGSGRLRGTAAAAAAAAGLPPQPDHLRPNAEVQQHLRLLALQQQQQGPAGRTQRPPRVVRLSNGQLAAALGPAEADESADPMASHPSLPRTRVVPYSAANDDGAEVVILPNGRRALVLPEPPPAQGEVRVPVQRSGGGGKTLPYNNSSLDVTGEDMPYSDGAVGPRDLLPAAATLGPLANKDAGAREVANGEFDGSSGTWVLELGSDPQQQQLPLVQQHALAAALYKAVKSASGRFGAQQLPDNAKLPDLSLLQPQQQQDQDQQDDPDYEEPQPQSRQHRRAGAKAAQAAPPAEVQSPLAVAAAPQPLEPRSRLPAAAPLVPASAAIGGRAKATPIPTASGVPAGSTATSSLAAVPVKVGSPCGTLQSAATAAAADAAGGGGGSMSAGPRVMRTNDGRVFLVEPVQGVDGDAAAALAANSGGAPEPANSLLTTMAHSPAPSARRRQTPAASDSAMSGPSSGTAAKAAAAAAAAAGAPAPGSVTTATTSSGAAPRLASAVIGLVPVGTAGSGHGIRRLLLQPIGASAKDLGVDARELPRVQTGPVVALQPPPAGRAAVTNAAVANGTALSAPSAAATVSGANGEASAGMTRGPSQALELCPSKPLAAAVAAADGMQLPSRGSAPQESARQPPPQMPSVAAAALERGRSTAGCETVPQEAPTVPMAATVGLGAVATVKLEPGTEEPGTADAARHVQGDGTSATALTAAGPGAGLRPGLKAASMPPAVSLEELEAAGPHAWANYLQAVLLLAATPLPSPSATNGAPPVPAFGRKPAFLKAPEQDRAMTEQPEVPLSLRLILRGNDTAGRSSGGGGRGSGGGTTVNGVPMQLPAGDLEVFRMCGEVPRELQPLFPAVMTVSDICSRKEIAVTNARSKPVMLWQSPESTPEQLEAGARLSKIRVGFIVHLDEQHDFVLSPQEIRGEVVLISVFLQRSSTGCRLAGSNTAAQTAGTDGQAGTDAAAGAPAPLAAAAGAPKQLAAAAERSDASS